MSANIAALTQLSVECELYIEPDPWQFHQHISH